MKKFIVLLSLSFSFVLCSKAQQYNYAKKIAGTSNDRCNDVVSDKSSNVYFCGTFSGYLGIANLLSLTSVNSDAFIVKIDARSGKPIWAKGSTGTSNEGANAIAIDKSGNLYVAGVFNSNVKFGNITSTGSGLENMYIAKFNTQGGLIWLKMAGGLAQTRVSPKDIKIGDDNNLYITGSLRGSVNFGNINVKSINSNTSTSDVFVAKYDTSGTSIWVNNFGKSGLTEGNGIETDLNGNIYIGGTHSDTLIAGNDTLVGNNFYFMFVLALDKNGKHRWLKRHSNYGGSVNAIKMNNKGQLFATGESNKNAFLMQLDTSDGKSKWFKETTNGYTSAKAMAIDKKGNIYVTGGVFYGGTFENIFIKTECACSNNGFDMFTARFNDTGKVIWVQQGGGGIFDDIGYGIELDSKGDAYTVGIYASDANFGNITLTAYSGQQTEGFVAKINTGLIYGKQLTSNICTNNGSIPFIYTLNTRMLVGNKIKFEMSDTGGIFNQPKLTELSDTSMGSDTVFIPMPKNKLALKSYQFRITTTAPIDTFYLADGLIFQPIPRSFFTVNDSIQCISSNVFNFSNLSTGPTGTLTYKWDLNDGNIATVKNINPKTYKNAGIYKVSLETTTTKLCKDTFRKTLIVQGKPLVNFTINDSTQCLKSNQFNFVNTSTINDSSKLRLFWSYGDGKTDTISAPKHSYTASGTYTIKLKAISTEGCIDSGSRKVLIEDVNIKRDKIDAHCEGQSGRITPKDPNQTYNWLKNDTLMLNTGNSLEITQSGIYKFISIRSIGCSDTSLPDTFVFHSSPLKPKLLKNNSTISVSNIYAKYQWYKDGILINGDTSYQKVYTQNGKYFVKVFNNWGCETNSDTLDTNLSSILSSTSTKVLIFPNPTSTTLTVEILGLSQNEPFRIYIYSLQGTLIEEKTFTGNTGILDVNDLSSGMYLLSIKTEKFLGNYYFMHK